MGGKRRVAPSRSSSGKKPRRPSSAGKTNAAKKRRLDEDHVGKPRRYGAGPGLDVVDDFAALRAMHSNGGNTAALRQMEVFEWVGDAVIGELVARCLLSQFHHSPLSARVFRNLRLGVVTNQNLASVFDLIGYQRHTIEERKRKTKEKADVVEAVAGEIIVRLELQKRDTRVCTRLRSHLDELIAAMLQEHFKERRRVHQKAVMSGPLRVSFNAFDCLPQEDLDEDTGELVVHVGSIDAIDGYVRRDSDGDELRQKSIADLIEECEHDDKPRAGVVAAAFNSFINSNGFLEANAPDWDMFSFPLNEWRKRDVGEIYRRTSLKLRLLDSEHILRSSREIYDVFKIYGMAVLAERVSLTLAFPHMCFRRSQDPQTSVSPSPSLLTTQRQSVLCMANMERCAIFLGLCPAGTVDEDEFAIRRLRANSLRAFVGYYSAIAAEDGAQSIADDVASLLQYLVFETSPESAPRSRLPPSPRREPLGVLPSAVTETTDFLTSQVCADLHEAGERPKPPSAPKLLLRKCDSETVEDLFETLARRSLNLERSAKRSGDGDDESLSRRRKRKRSESDPDAKTHHAKPSPNLARFLHRRFLFCMEELVVLFAQRKTEECRLKMSLFETDLEPCAGDAFRKWEVSTSTLTMAIPESFHRLLLHDLCHFHALVSTSKTTRDGTRITQLRLPLHYTWSKIQRRVTVEEEATG